MTERETLKKWLDESSNIVFFGETARVFIPIESEN